MTKNQPILGHKGTLFFLVIISAFPPLTTDLYLPALPQMVEILNTTQVMVNLTLSVYFVTYAVGLLFWGPLSEKFGRKPILLIGLGVYMLASVLCAIAFNIDILIGARSLQAFGGSAITVVATAIVKDMFSGREREKIMATIMSLVIIAPMVAPVIGALLLKVASWHMMFVFLASFGLVATLVALCYTETLEHRYEGSMLRSWSRLITVFKNPHFVALLAIFSLTPMALMAFLAAGSYIYINGFGLTEQQFSYAFAFNALFASFGPTIYMKVSKRVRTQSIITACYVMIALLGVLTLTIGHLSPWIFAFIAAPITMAIITTRIPGTNLMLDQQEKDTGSAVAIIQFSSMMAGSLGMVLVSLRQQALIEDLGLIQIGVGCLGLVMWLLVKNRDFVTRNIINSKK
ncbi:putative drug resistance transporter [Vibrio halioticoli NBRC 102217]|uniref:Bcr/CflA family efflux transporter n=1 Tax=Vibrio halioticoli NBRC 102217 TaxID=1219072 RepID=V5HFD5_9VIBR|nr:multidrug effflux MFS transporter [Vibrio halioticoli]GAD88235.1 putative drug resistance transporter [Vibrio halioticoli NBRC 102217]